MKTLLIETVTNGWIVRPFSSRLDWGTVDQGIIAVYNNLTDLQIDLPKLLNERPPVPGTVTVTPETIGGSETPF